MYTHTLSLLSTYTTSFTVYILQTLKSLCCMYTYVCMCMFAYGQCHYVV